MNKTQLLEDLYYYRDTLPVKHKNLFNKISKEIFTDKVAQIAVKADTLNLDQFIYELFKLNVEIGDEHTRIEPIYLSRVPVIFEHFTDGIFVTGIETSHSDVLLSKLIEINQIPIEEINSRFTEVIKHDNLSYFEVNKLKCLNNASFLKGMGITKSAEEIEYTLQNNKNETTHVKLKSLPVSVSKDIKMTGASFSLLSDSNHSVNYWFRYDSIAKTMYFNFVHCRNDEKYLFSDFNQGLFAKINEVHPNKLVVDLRYNEGGNSSVINPFLDSLHNSYLNRKGQLFVLIGKQTFSSAVMNAVYLKRNTKAILVGEMTSGNINHYGEVRGFGLPNSKVVIAYSTRYWENWKGKKGALNPDKRIKYFSADYIKSQDPALEFVYSF